MTTDRPATAVILAAGAGRRLGARGHSMSKAMVPLLGRPMVQWVWERVAAAGVGRIVVVAHASDEALRRFVAGTALDIHVVVQSQRKGIADAIVQALPEVGEGSYLACACDSVFRVGDIRRVIEAGRTDPAAAVVAVQAMGVEATSTRSAVEIDDSAVLRLLEKPPPGTTMSPLVALPLYWLPSSVAGHLRDAAPVGGERHVSTALNQFIAAGGSVRAIRVTHRVEVTTAEDIALAERELR